MMDTYDTRTVLAAVRRAVDDAAPDARPDPGLCHIMTSARSRRRRRRLAAGGTAGAGLAAGAALALTLASSPGPGPATSVRTAAWTVRADSNGTVTLDMSRFADSAQLQRVLNEDKIPALVIRSLRLCSAESGLERNQLINNRPDAVPTAARPIALPAAHGRDWTMVVDPALLPSGWELVITSGVFARGPQVAGPATPGYPGPGQDGVVMFRVVKQAPYPDCR
jgi:hypothetical protein